MKTLHTAYRVTDLAASLDFYTALGYGQVGRVDHLVVQVDDLGTTVEALAGARLRPGPVERPGGPEGPQTAWLTDPDGYRIELVQWPPGHADGLSAADFG